MPTAEEYREGSEQMNRLAELQEEQDETKDEIEEALGTKLASVNDYIMSDYEAVNLLSKNLNINASDARKQLSSFPNEYSIDGENIPDLVRKMRKARRKLKGEQRTKMAKAIDTVIDGYSDHINKCIDSIYWIKPYKPAILKMGFSEKDLMKINKIDSVNDRRNIIDAICKYWENDLKKDGMVYSTEYAQLEKECRVAKRDYKKQIKNISDQSITKSKKERIGRMLQMHANSREDIKEARAGDIIAICGLKSVTTGDTLCDPNKPIILERMEFPDPVIEVAVEPKTKADQEKMSEALGRLAAEDPSFGVSSDIESGQTIIKGMGELHLDIIVDRMKREFKVEADVGAPQVAYRETITSEADVDYTHKKQSGGAGQFARVKMVVKKGEPGCGLEFVNKVVGGNIPKEYIPGVQKGIESAMQNGVVAGYPVIDISVTLYDGAYHDVDSSVMAFEIAGRSAFKDALSKSKPKLLEPMMRVEVVTPEDFVGDVIGDLNSRRGQVQGMEPQGNATLVKANVPLATMFGYVNNLRSMTQGRAVYTMQFDKYELVPAMVEEELKSKLAS